MKLLLVCVIGILLGWMYLYQPAAKQKHCYDAAQTSITEIGYLTAARGWNLYDICQKRTDILLDLHDCIEKVSISSLVKNSMPSTVERIVSLLRPTAKGFITLK